MFLESRYTDEINIICEKTKRKCDIKFYAYDKDSLDLLESRIKDHQYDNYNIYMATPSGNKWIAHTSTVYYLDPGRKFDKYLCSDKIEYSYDDILILLEDEDLMIVVI